MIEAYQRGEVPRIVRSLLVARILNEGAQIVVIEGPAGIGKSWLMEDLALASGTLLCTRSDLPSTAEPSNDDPGQVLWDIPAVAISGRLPEGRKVILAKRPTTAVPGLARAEVYRRVARIPVSDLLFTEAGIGAGLFARTGGWACLLPATRLALDAVVQGQVAAGGDGSHRRTSDPSPDSGPVAEPESDPEENAYAEPNTYPDGRPDPLAEFLRDDVLTGLSAGQLIAFDMVLSGTRTLPHRLLKGLPFLDGGMRTLPAPLAACAPAMRRALAARIAIMRDDPQGARAVAEAQKALGRVPDAIATYQGIGAWRAARQALSEAHGPFFIQAFGAAAHDAVLAGFPPDMLQEDELLVHCRAIQAAKRGDTALARVIMAERYGTEATDVAAVMAAPQRYPREMRFVRFLLSTWEDTDLTPDLVGHGFVLLSRIPVEDDLRRGAFYNAILEIYMFDRRWAEADGAAIQAEWHYDRAGVPILSFYVDLHRAIIQLSMGRPVAAARFADSAGARLARVPYDSPGDVRVLALMRACIDYERGRPEPLARFLSVDFDAFSRGELWPSLIEMVLIYGSQALSEHVSTMGARAFLDRWRGAEARSGKYRRLIDLREIVILQNANRWQEAAQRAQALSGRVSPDWVVASEAQLSTLQDRDEVALALVWLRHLVQLEPMRPGLAELLAAITTNPHLTVRQRTGAEIWRAHVLRRQKQGAESLALLTDCLSHAAGNGALAILGEERGFLNEMTAPRRVREALDRSEPVRRVLRQLQDTGPGRNRRGRQHGLTRQEMRILYGIAEGSTNKAIANAMGLSEATVKFHLANLYRKLGCQSRREAVNAASALRLIG